MAAAVNWFACDIVSFLPDCAATSLRNASTWPHDELLPF